MKIYVHTKSCTWICIVALFIIAKNWKKTRCSQEMNVKLWHIHTMEYYTINYWYTPLFEWFSRELCWVKKSQFRKITYCTIPVIWYSWNAKIIEMDNILVAGIWQEGGRVTWGIVWWWNCSAFWLYQCQYPGCATVLQFCKMLLGERYIGSLYYFLQTACESSIITK